MMTKYALLYERLNIETHEQETVVAFYVEGTRTAERYEYIQAPRQDAEQAMITQGWRYASSAGPQSILLKREAE
jgi:hypothetical protein